MRPPDIEFGTILGEVSQATRIVLFNKALHPAPCGCELPVSALISDFFRDDETVTGMRFERKSEVELLTFAVALADSCIKTFQWLAAR